MIAHDAAPRAGTRGSGRIIDGDSRNSITRLRLTGNRCRCAACGEHFNSVSVFDRHRVGKYAPDLRRCLSVAKISALGWQRNKAEFWIRGHKPPDSWHSARRRRDLPEAGLGAGVQL